MQQIKSGASDLKKKKKRNSINPFNNRGQIPLSASRAKIWTHNDCQKDSFWFFSKAHIVCVCVCVITCRYFGLFYCVFSLHLRVFKEFELIRCLVGFFV